MNGGDAPKMVVPPMPGIARRGYPLAVGPDGQSPYGLDGGDKLALLGGLLANLGGNPGVMQASSAVIGLRQAQKAARLRQAGLQALFGPQAGGQSPPTAREPTVNPPSELGWSGDLASDLGLPKTAIAQARSPGRNMADRTAAAIMMGIPADEVAAYQKASEMDQPKGENVNGWFIDKGDAANIGRYFPALDKDQEPVYDGNGRVVGVRSMDGAIKSIGEVTRAQEDAKNASQASYAEIRSAAEARGKAPYDFREVTGPNGEPMTVSGAYLAGREAGQGGPITGQRPDDAQYRKNVADQSAKSYDTIQQAGTQAPMRLAKLRAIDQLLSGWEGNKFSRTGVEIARAMNTAGWKIDPKTSNAEAAMALQGEMALAARSPQGGGGGMPGAMSDADRQFLMNMTPGLEQSAAGRQKLIQIQSALAQRDADVARMARQWQQRYGRIDAVNPATGKSFFDNLQEWSGRNLLFSR